MGLLDRVKSFIFEPGHTDDTYEEVIVEDFAYDYGERDDVIPISSGRRDRSDRSGDTVSLTPRKVSPKIDNDITPMPGLGSHIITIEPKNIDEAANICDLLKQDKIVVVKMEGVDQKDAQRVLDFLSGVTYCIKGQVHEVTNRIFFAVPQNVEITEHHKEQLKSHGIFSSFKTNFAVRYGT